MENNSDVGYSHVTNEARIIEGQDSKKEFPFDLNNLFNMQYSFDQLKMAIEYLAKNQSDQQTLLNDLLSRDPSQLPFTVLEKDGDLVDKDGNMIDKEGKFVDEDGNRSASPHQSTRNGNGSGLNGRDASAASLGLGKDGLGNGTKSAKSLKNNGGEYNNPYANQGDTDPSAAFEDARRFKKMKADFEERIAALEALTQKHTAKHDLTDNNVADHEVRISSLENALKMMQSMQRRSGTPDSAPGMDADKSNEVIQAINDIAENIRKECDKKFAPLNSFGSGGNDKQLDGLYRRVQNLEKSLGEVNENLDEKGQLIEHNRKTIAKNTRDIEELKKRGLSGGASAESLGEVVSLPKLEALAGTVTQENLPQAIGHVVNYIKKLDVHVSQDTNDLKDEMQHQKEMHSALLKQVGELATKSAGGVTADDVKRWNDNVVKTKELEDIVAALKRELTALDANKMKIELQNLLSMVKNFVTKDMLDALNEEIRKARQECADLKYESQGQRETLNKCQKKIDDNQRSNEQEQQMLKVKNDALDSQVQALKKMMQKLNEQHKEMLKTAASGGNPMASAFAKDLEDQIARLKADLEATKVNTGKQFKVQQAEIDTKASKQDLEDLEARLMEKLQELMNNLANMFADKDQMRKKFLSLEKNIKNLYDLIMSMQNGNDRPNEDDAMFTTKHVGPVACASCEKGIVNLLGQQADYLAWKRLPFREPSERIAKYGQGFSKILTMMRPTQQEQGFRNERSATVDYGHPNGQNEYKTDDDQAAHGHAYSPQPKGTHHNSSEYMNAVDNSTTAGGDITHKESARQSNSSYPNKYYTQHKNSTSKMRVGNAKRESVETSPLKMAATQPNGDDHLPQLRGAKAKY